MRAAIYTRKSTDEGLEMEFNSLDHQRESVSSIARARVGRRWRIDTMTAASLANIERPALRRLLADIEAGKDDCVVVYKVDRLSRSLLDFGRLMELFTKHNVAFVSVTQQIDTSTSMGRLMLNVLLSFFAQFERELVSERTRTRSKPAACEVSTAVDARSLATTRATPSWSSIPRKPSTSEPSSSCTSTADR